MTLDDLKGKPLRRNDALMHGVLGIVLYKSKVRYKPEEIVVQRTDNSERVRVFLSSVTREGKSAKTQPSRLILCRCETCDLKIRISAQWLDTGKPTCFNEQCEQNGTPLTIEYGKQNKEGWRGNMREGDIRNATREPIRPNDPDKQDDDDFLTEAGKL